jgi:hypothetical protein
MITQADLEYLGKMRGRHAWAYEGDYYYWTERANIVTTDSMGVVPFCHVTLKLQHGKANTIQPLSRADAKRAIVAKLNATEIKGVHHE